MAKMRKTQYNKVQALLEKFSEINGLDLAEANEELNTLYTAEDSYYEGQAVYNFFKSRIEPRLEKNETPADFDKRFREWRIKKCDNCNEEFAYALNYEGVSFCSLECLDEALKRIGLKVTRGRDLKKRWGVHFHPAIVPSSAFAALKTSYGEASPEAFAPSD